MIMDEIIMSMADKVRSYEENIIKEAFEEKFGLSLDMRIAPLVQRLEMEGSPYVYYRYNGTDFLVMDKDLDFQMVNEVGRVSVTYQKRYKKL